MKRTNELVSRAFMKTFRTKLLKLTDREFSTVVPALEEVLSVVTAIRKSELEEWNEIKSRDLDIFNH